MLRHLANQVKRRQTTCVFWVGVCNVHHPTCHLFRDAVVLLVLFGDLKQSLYKSPSMHQSAKACQSTESGDMKLCVGGGLECRGAQTCCAGLSYYFKVCRQIVVFFCRCCYEKASIWAWDSILGCNEGAECNVCFKHINPHNLHD